MSRVFGWAACAAVALAFTAGPSLVEALASALPPAAAWAAFAGALAAGCALVRGASEW